MVSESCKSLLLIAVLAGTMLACGGSSDEKAETKAPEDQGSELPPGHPSTTPQVPASAGKGGLTWDKPEGWVEETPSSSMRRAQYRVPGESGDGECVAFYFGPGQGGDAQANADRWAGQFEQPDGRPSSDVMEIRTTDVNGISIMIIEVTGTYHSGSMMGGPTTANPDHMLLGAIAEGQDANWFFKFTGPEATVRANREAFESMLKTLRLRQ